MTPTTGTLLRAALAACALGAGTPACSGESPPRAGAGGTASEAPLASGLLTFDEEPHRRVVPARATGPTRLAAGDPRNDIEVAVDACRWEWPGRMGFDITVSFPPSIGLPVTVPLSVSLISGDTGSGFTVDVTVDEPGTVTFVVPDLDERMRSGAQGVAEPGRWTGFRPEATRWTTTSCHVSVPTTERSDEFATSPVTIDGRPPQVDAPDGTVAGLLSLIDPGDPAEELLALADLYNHPGWPAIDKLFIAPTVPMERIGIVAEGTCITISTTYRTTPGDAPTHDYVDITQRHGCAASGRPDRNDPATNGSAGLIRIEDAAWEVLVRGEGDDPAKVIAALTVLPWDPVASSTSTQASGFEPARHLDAWFTQRTDVREIGRAPWHGGLVAGYVVVDHPSLRSTANVGTVVAVAGERDNGPRMSMNCIEQAVLGGATADQTDGYLAFVVTARIVRVELYGEGGWRDIALGTEAHGRRFGLADDPPASVTASPTGDRYRFSDAGGDPVPCVQ